MAIYSQNVLDTKVDFIAENLPITTALENLSQQTNISITFTPNFFQKGKKVTIRAKNKSLGAILNRILAETEIGFKIIDKHLVLYKKPPRKLQNFTISGYLSDAETGERLVAANIYSYKHARGTISNEYGFFSLTLPEGAMDLTVSYLGYGEQSEKLNLTQNVKRNIALKPSVTLAEIIVTPNDSALAFSNLSGAQKISMPQAQGMPDLGGESDIIRMVHLLPGVQSGVDGFGGMYVRGGNVDQNLMLVDGVPIYNASHLFGMFSIYNTDAIRSATFLKGGFPARYGGRISSVFDVRTKEGNQNNFSAEAGIGLVSGKLRLETPVFKKKGSILVAGRSTLTDVFTKPIANKLFQLEGDHTKSDFLDLNFKFNYAFSDLDRLFVSYYNGLDEFMAEEEVLIFDGFQEEGFEGDAESELLWGNDILALRWNHLYNGKLFSNTTFTYSQYRFFSRNYYESPFFTNKETGEEEEGFVFFSITSDIKDFTLKTDFDWLPSYGHHVRFGTGLTAHTILLGQSYIEPEDIEDLEDFNIDDFNLENAKIYEEDEFSMEGLEWYGYVEDDIQITNNWRANIGLRASAFFTNDQNWFHFEPRFNTNYAFSEKFSLNASISKMVQYLHQISYSGLGLPGDSWITAFPELPPQTSWQSTFGARFSPPNQWTLSVEGYYKKMDKLIFFPSDYQIEDDTTGFGGGDDLVLGQGWGYGLEFLLKKDFGKTSGWLSYSYAFAERQSEGVNLGNRFAFRHDRRHKINLVLFHKLNNWLELGANFVLGSANPAFVTEGSLLIEQEVFILDINQPGKKNKHRAGVYQRVDFGAKLNFGKNRLKHLIKLSVYNVLNRKNPVYYRSEEEDNVLGIGESVSVLGIRPAVSYSLKF